MKRWLFSLSLPGVVGVATVGCGVPINDIPLEPGSEVVRAAFDVDVYSAYDSPVIPAFDTRSGALILDQMTIRIEHSARARVTLQNASDVDLAEGDFVMDHYFNTLTQLGLPPDNETDGGGPPFFGPGSFWIQVETALGPQGSATDQFEDTFEETIRFEADYTPEDEPSFLEAMTDTGDVTVVIGGFSETFFNFDPSLKDSGVQIDWQVPTLQYTGELEIEYHFSVAE